MSTLHRIGLLAVLFIACTQLAEAEKVLPEKFSGSWDVNESDNFDEYLQARGYNWFMRQIILYSPVTKVFEKSMTKTGTYNAFILTPTKNARWYGWKLGKPFEGLYVDDDKHEITFDYDSKTDTLTEFHKNLDNKSEPTDLIKYQVNNEGRLVMTVEAKGVSSQRFYDKQKK